MTITEANRYVGCLVRISPHSRGGRTKHWGRARLVAVDGRRCWIRPLGRHRQDETIDPSHIKLWMGKF